MNERTHLDSAATAIVQAYLERVLDSALCKDSDFQKICLSIIEQVIENGLCHPLKVCAMSTFGTYL